MKVVNAVKDIFKRKKDFVTLGNLYSKRDWGHAKDYVRGMWLMLQQDTPDDFVLATGKTITVKEFVTKAFLHKGFRLFEREKTQEVAYDQKGNIRVKIDPKYYRPCEVDLCRKQILQKLSIN